LATLCIAGHRASVRRRKRRGLFRSQGERIFGATMRRWLHRGAAAVLLATAILASVARLGPLPRLGPFLDPVHGVWGVARGAALAAAVHAELPGLGEAVQVVVDDRGVPHIFAESEEDAYRAMGWVVARDRLFQLELQTRAAAGTLTELLGPDLLELDRQARALGLARGAERELAAYDTTGAAYRAVLAYAGGVNAYLEALTPAQLPLEYRLLDRRPQRWAPLHTFLLFSRMGLTLASDDPATTRLAAAALVGSAAAEALVPLNHPIQEPIQPARRGAPRYTLRGLPPPGAPDSVAAALMAALPGSFRGPEGAEPFVGSNSWAVAPGRTSAGFGLLAGDPHLELTLPSIWYEAHLVVPGRMDVAGVSLPGSPGIVIGFNRDVAWTFTNTQGDVADLYRETVDDSASPTAYLLDARWRPLDLRVETYTAPDGRILAVDTVRYSHRGPLSRRGELWLSRRWTVLEPSPELDLFLRAAQSPSVDEWLEIMRDYVAPTQNGLVADRAGNLAIRSSGTYPIRPGDGRGDVIRDGSRAGEDWTGALPVEAYPFAKNPAQGFLASANQQPVDPLDNPAYLGADWIPPWRALRINALLRADSAVTPEAMRRLQTDPGNHRADLLVPLLLEAAQTVLAQGESESLRRAADLLRGWSRTYEPENRRVILFEMAVAEAMRRVWDELRPKGSGRAFSPYDAVLLELAEDPTSIWWDDRGTPQRERAPEILAASLAAALDTGLARYGEPDSEAWAWRRIRTANIYHMLRIPSLSVLGLPVGGGNGTLAPLSGRGTHGASWRMVVELGPEVRAWATYPGGQSGNPASRFYDDRIGGWARGELEPVLFPPSPDALAADRVLTRISLVPAERP